MIKKLEIWKFAAERLRRDETVMLLVVAESSGSSPGRQGFKMIVAEDELCGSIGGGAMEVRMAETAKWKMENGKWKMDSKPTKSKTQNPKSKIVEQVHRKNSPNPSGMICSGKQTIIFFQLDSEHLTTVREIIRALKTHQPNNLQISDSNFQIAENQFNEFDFRFERRGENKFLYEEKLGFKNKLFIVGGGHCALALAELMSKMDFYISLFDDREELNTIEKNKYVHEKIIIDSYTQIGEYIPSGASHYVVVMTIGYKSDEVVIRALFGKNFKYLGVLGSKAKMKTLLRNLEKEGLDQAKLDQIRTPIGLPINSQTPEEIAVSIAAEIVMRKNETQKD